MQWQACLCCCGSSGGDAGRRRLLCIACCGAARVLARWRARAALADLTQQVVRPRVQLLDVSEACRARRLQCAQYWLAARQAAGRHQYHGWMQQL